MPNIFLSWLTWMAVDSLPIIPFALIYSFYLMDEIYSNYRIAPNSWQHPMQRRALLPWSPHKPSNTSLNPILSALQYPITELLHGSPFVHLSHYNKHKPNCMCSWWSLAGGHRHKLGFSFCNMYCHIVISATGKFCYVVDCDIFSFFNACGCLGPQIENRKSTISPFRLTLTFVWEMVATGGQWCWLLRSEVALSLKEMWRSSLEP